VETGLDTADGTETETEAWTEIGNRGETEEETEVAEDILEEEGAVLVVEETSVAPMKSADPPAWLIS
jgi:hypothetical protein